MPELVAVCRDLSKTYLTPSGGIEALHAVDAEFAAGRVTALVGASGSGKSTLLRALAGLDRPTGGSVVVAGTELAHASAATLRRHRRGAVAFLNQRPAENFVPHLTMRDHDRGAAVALLVEFGLGHRLDARPVELSGGEQARAAFALALARATPILLADEPTAELDRGSAAALLAAIREHAGAGTSVIIATHDDDVIAIADARCASTAAASPRPPTPSHRVADRHARRRPRRSWPPAGSRRATGGARNRSMRSETARLNFPAARSGRSLAAPVPASPRSSLSSPACNSPTRASSRSPSTRDFPGRNSRSSPSASASFPNSRFGRTSSTRRDSPATSPSTPRDVEHLLDRLGLNELARRPPHETSIGQQQRTALARALVLRPTILLADEPTSHQDAGWRDAVWELIVDTAESATGCLIATHEDQIAQYANRVWTIDGGAIGTKR